MKAKGSYLLILHLPSAQKIKIGRRKEIFFREGFYVYVGSALGGFLPRISHHLGGKAKRWHVDFLRGRASLEEVILIPSEERKECEIAGKLSARLPVVRNFGSTDCGCPGHLFFAPSREELERALGGFGGFRIRP